MTDRFRLIYLKSNEAEENAWASRSPSPDLAERGDLESKFSESLVVLQRLKQAISDLKHPDPKIRVLAIKYYLEKSHLSLPVPLLQEILSDPDGGVRAEALSMLITFGNPIVSPFLKKYLKDPDPRVRLVALKGIFRFKEKMDLNLLMQFLSDESPWVRRKVATLLGWNPVEGDFPILVALSKDKDARVRKAALSSLLTSHPEEGEERLLEAMKDADPEVRRWAREELNRILERPLKASHADKG
ncbi:MAG: HEAT repeat domain-containing protein [Desulfobacterota bacterium]|nr:HEAT repeat domain-containing protein [Thermodesulfobacteriota bacterium]